MSNRRPLTDSQIAVQGKKDKDKFYADGQGRAMVNMEPKASVKNPVIWIIVLTTFIVLLPILIYHVSPGGDLGGGENAAGTTGGADTVEVAEESDDAAVSGDFDAVQFARDNCAACHGSDFTGSMGPSILGLDTDTFETAVREGPGAMPEYTADQITDEDLTFMAEYFANLE